MIPGAQAWSAEGDQTGVLVLHGLTGNPVSVRPLAEALAEAGFTVELPLLPGHGTCWRDLAKTTWQDWELGATRAFERLCVRTSTQVIVGLSMGGALTLRLAQQLERDAADGAERDAADGAEWVPAELAGIVLINPSLFTRHRWAWLAPVLARVVPSIKSVGNDIAKPGADERSYDRMPLSAVCSLSRLWDVVRADLAVVKVPVLVFTSRQDHVVEPENSAAALAGVSSIDREQVWLERSYHLATLDHDAEEITERTIAFVRRVTAGDRAV